MLMAAAQDVAPRSELKTESQLPVFRSVAPILADLRPATKQRQLIPFSDTHL